MENKNRAGIPVTLKKAFSSNGSILIVLLLFLFCGIRFGNGFLNATNLLNIVKQMSITGIAAIGINFVIISGGRDLSCGSIAAVSAIIAAFLTPYGTIPAVLGGVAVGLVFGLFNGFIITYMSVTPLIGTLGTQWAIRSIALLLNNNTSVAIDESLSLFVFIGRGDLFGFLPMPTVIFGCLLVAGHILLKHTCFGRHVMAIGGQEESAVMMGLPTKRTKMGVYLLSGLMASTAGLVLCSRMGCGQPQSGISWGMDIMAIVVIGGTLIRGGKGNMIGVILGALIMNIVSNMINLFGNINAYIQDIINACMLLMAVLFQTLAASRFMHKNKEDVKA